MSFWVAVQRVLREADIIVLVADARMPTLSLNRELHEKLDQSGKLWLLVFNKMDLISVAERAALTKEYPGSLLVAGIKNEGISLLKRTLQIMAKRHHIDEPHIGIVGYPNIGKSAIINAIAHRSRALVSSKAGTTKGIQWVRAGNLKVLDSPGVIPFEDNPLTLGVLGAKDPEKLKQPEKVALHIIKFFIPDNIKKIEEYAGVSLSNEPEEILEAIGRKRGYLKKGGIVDEVKTSINLIRDWQKGKLKLS